MTHCAFTITVGGAIVPADRPTGEYVAKQKLGTVIHGDFRKARNYQFHKKFFALLGYAFDYWNPELPIAHGKQARKSFDQFRNDLVILAGYYDVLVRLDGSARVKAKSISFSSMGEDEFEKLYSKVIDVILERVLVDTERADLEEVVENILSFS